MSFGTKGCMYCEGECNKECLPKQENKQETLEEFIKREGYHDVPTQEIWEDGVRLGADWQSKRMYSEEDMSKSFFQGWVTRERFDDQIPDIIYPQGLDYEEKQEYAFNLWFEQFKKK
jgi:hypothetical protein